jgi:DNA-binding HxlR family transcriptional regulator
MGSLLSPADKSLGSIRMEIIKAIVEDTTLGAAEKVLFAILYCRKVGDECRLSVNQLIEYVGVELKTLRQSLKNLEQGGFIKIKEECEIIDATSFLACTVLGEELRHNRPDVPRP